MPWTHRCLVVLALALIGCGSGDREDAIALPVADAGFDYQLGEAYDPAADVDVVVRDRTAEPAAGDRYDICYVNGFQTQPDEVAFWIDEHPDLLLRDGSGAPVVDPAFADEMILDPSTPEQRSSLVELVGRWIDGCADAGFDAVEIDNLDTFERFPGRLTEDAAVRYARQLADRAHAAGLAIAQKNTAALVPRRADTTFDFAIVEQCNEYDECDVFAEGYGGRVYVVEYDPESFDRGCGDHPELAIILRDLELSSPRTGSYVRRAC